MTDESTESFYSKAHRPADATRGETSRAKEDELRRQKSIVVIIEDDFNSLTVEEKSNSAVLAETDNKSAGVMYPEDDSSKDGKQD